MRPLALEVAGFRGWREGALALDRPLTLIVGANASGKSSTLNALEWCLFGREAERKGSGVPERSDWKVAGGEGEVAVGLVCGTPEGTARIRRRRAARAGPRDEDELRVEREGHAPLEGADAAAWLREQGPPDWTTWRRAFCQHQEVLRARLVEGADRSSILAGLLGLDEHERLRGGVQELGAAKLVREIESIQQELERSLLALLSRPAEELEEEELRLEQLGLERALLRPELASEVARALVERAGRLASELGLEATLPGYRSEVDEAALLRWAEGWPDEVRRRSDVARRLAALRREQAELAGRLRRLELDEERWRRARDRVQALERERGGRAGQEAELDRVRAALAAAGDELRRENEHLALLSDARHQMGARGESDGCPVCGSRIPDLARRLDGELEERRDERLRALEKRRASLGEQEASLARHLRELDQAEQAEADGRAALEEVGRELEGLLPPESPAGGRQLAGAARERERALHAEAERLDATHGRLETELEEHRRGAERLRGLARWRAARQRAARRVEVTGSEAWAALDGAIDAAAGLACDLEAVGGLLRDAQARDSAEREREVNRALARGHAAILGPVDGRELVVRVKQTAKGLVYELVDGRGAKVLSTWNQAALNAASLALLFAQASERERRGEPAFLLLDDPTQGLDDEPQRGLARAIARLAERLPVIVAAPPGALADELWERGGLPRRRVTLGPRDPAGARIEAQEER